VVAAGGEGGDVFEFGDEDWLLLGWGLSAFVDRFGEADVAVGALVVSGSERVQKGLG
jgi:hypothetical protein